MVQAEALRSAVKWTSADEAHSRISAVKKTLDAAGGEAAPAPAAKQEHRAAATAGRQELRHGLSELDAVRSFLQDNLNTANRQYLSTGDKDEQLHSALQHGLSELEDVRRRLVRTLSTNDATAATAQRTTAPSSSNHPPQPPSGSKPSGVSAPPPRGVRSASAGGRPPSASARRNTGGAGVEDPAKKALQEHARRLFRGGGSRPASATVRSASAASAGESMHGTSDGLQFTASKLSQRPSSATTAKPSSSTTQRRSSSEGPRLMTGARSRPTSAPVRRDGNTNHTTTGSSSGAGGPSTSSAAAPSTTNNKDTSAANGQWNKYQDWAQKVMTSVHSRRVMKHREALERERNGGGGPSTASTSNNGGGPLRRTASGTAGTTTSSSQPGPSPPTPPPSSASGDSASAPKPAAATQKVPAPTPQQQARQRPQSAAFSSLRRAQAAAGSSGGPTAATPGGPPQRPASATVRGAHATPSSVVGGAGAAAGSSLKLDATAQSLREQGNVAFQQKRFAEAAEAYGRAITLEPTSELLYCNRAAAQLMLGKYHSALADAQAAIEIDPYHIKAHWRAAKSCLYLGQTDQARSLYGQAQKLAESQADKDAVAAESRAADLVDRCRRCIRLREYADAVKAADEVLQIFPPSGPCSMPWLCLRCEASMHVDATEALTAATRYTSDDPQCAEAWYLRGKAVFYTGHDAASTSAALGFLARCREVDMKHSRASVLQSSIEAFASLRDQGNSAYAGGRWQEAYVAYTKCLAVDPYNHSLKAIILCNRSAVCIQCERWKDGLDDITQSINCNPQNAKAFTRRARIFQHQGNMDAAVKDLQHAAQLFPSPENQERLQQLLEQRNRQQAPPPQQQQQSARPPPAGGGGGSGSNFRYFNFANGSSGATGAGPSRPSTAGASRPSHGASSGGGASRPSSASNGRGGSNPYSIPRPNSASTAAAAKDRDPSHYEVLGVARVADDKAVTRAYRDAALKWHPDKWMSASDVDKTRAEDMFKRISTAYATLKDATKRRQYDHSQF